MSKDPTAAKRTKRHREKRLAAGWVECSVEGCTKEAIAKGYCDNHYRRNKQYGNPLGGRIPPGTRQIFLDKAILHEDNIDCLKWPYSTDDKGYGVISGYETGYVHRIVCEAVHGKPPSKNHQAAHSCGKGHEGCVNPHHLYWATCKRNHADKKIHGTNNDGEKNGSAKLTETQVLKILKLHKAGKSSIYLSNQFGVSVRQIRNIISGTKWKYLTQRTET